VQKKREILGNLLIAICVPSLVPDGDKPTLKNTQIKQLEIFEYWLDSW
jgi:hypothetical protein